MSSIEKLNEENKDGENCESSGSSHEIHHMRCRVHTLQHAIHDALRSETVARLLIKASCSHCQNAQDRPHHQVTWRKIYNSRSNHTLRFRLTDACAHSWIKSILVDMEKPQANLSSTQWDQVSFLEVLVCKIFKTTKRMQEDLTPGIFWRK